MAENVLEVECVISKVAETDTTDYYVVTRLEISLSLDHGFPASVNTASVNQNKPRETGTPTKQK